MDKKTWREKKIAKYHRLQCCCTPSCCSRCCKSKVCVGSCQTCMGCGFCLLVMILVLLSPFLGVLIIAIALICLAVALVSFCCCCCCCCQIRNIWKKFQDKPAIRCYARCFSCCPCCFCCCLSPEDILESRLNSGLSSEKFPNDNIDPNIDIVRVDPPCQLNDPVVCQV